MALHCFDDDESEPHIYISLEDRLVYAKGTISSNLSYLKTEPKIIHKHMSLNSSIKLWDVIQVQPKSRNSYPLKLGVVGVYLSKNITTLVCVQNHYLVTEIKRLLELLKEHEGNYLACTQI